MISSDDSITDPSNSTAFIGYSFSPMNFDQNEPDVKSSTSFEFNNSDNQSHTNGDFYNFSEDINIQWPMDDTNLGSDEDKKIFFCEKVEHPKFNVFIPRNLDNLSNNIIYKISNEILVDGHQLRKSRKENADNIRKKIKAKFLKALKTKLNEKLKSAGSIYFFDSLPQIFISNTSILINSSVLNLTLEQMYSKKLWINENCSKADIKKYKYNKFVLNYLENNKNVEETSNFNIIKNMKYSELFQQYLLSEDFEKDVEQLYLKKEKNSYIKSFINKAKNFINFFSNGENNSNLFHL